MRSWAALACALGLSVPGCGVQAFSCSDDAMCDRATGGRCELSGYCSFPDAACPSGHRFGEHAPSGLAMRCTEEEGTTDLDPTGAHTTGTPTDTDADADAGSSDAASQGPSTGGGSVGPVTCADWWDCEWAFRREIVVSGDVAEALDHFPVPLTLDDVSDPARFQAGGLDLRVVVEDGTLLPLEIETWSTGAPSAIWVALPRIEPGVGARAWLYYGNPGARPQDTSAEVWDASFAAVWHLSSADDATAHGNDAEDQGSLPAAGMIGDARAFDTAGQRLLVPASETLADLPVDGVTITAWIRPTTPGFVSGGRIIDNANGTSALHGFTFLTSPTTLGLEWNRGAETSEGSWIDMDSLAYGRWQHVALTFVDGTAPICLVDGAPMDFETATPEIGTIGSDVGSPFGIGGAPYGVNHTFDGTIDELRVSRGVRSEAWILAELAAATGRLVALGPEQSAPL